VVRSRDGQHWVLPKGHIDPGESAEQAALREVREEAGVVGEIVAPLGTDRYTATRARRAGCEIRVAYFLMRFAGEVPADEERELRWLAPEEAQRSVDFPGPQAIVEAARVLLAQGRAPK
jgi:8-oxo-dGTP pyrophosphatase MutT (NUDIX family)